MLCSFLHSPCLLSERIHSFLLSIATVEKEVPAARQAFVDLNLTNESFRCAACGGKDGCLECTPKIIYVVAQNNAGICVAPKDRDWRKNNVPSGTCIDDVSVLFGTPDTATRDTGDFLLVAHGGLKGTSRSICYKVIHDENSVNPAKLSKLTYNLSFQHGTATKATRELSLIKCSKRLSNITLASLAYLINPSEWSASESGLHTRNGDPRILPAHSPFDDNGLSEWRLPFRSHLAG